MQSIWRKKNKNKMTLKHILVGQLLKTTWISNTGFPWNSNSTSFNGGRHQDWISAADQMPHSRKQLTHSSAQLYTVPFAYRASSLMHLQLCSLCWQPAPCAPWREKAKLDLCTLPKGTQSWHVTGCLTSARMFSSTRWKATKHPTANLSSDNIFLEHVT